MSSPKFSIIVPVYNAEKHLFKCIDSLISQTYRNIEVITVNDGSTDLSLSVLYECATRDSRIKVFTQSNAGPSAARNMGLEKANGEYISFVDSDDWIETNTFEHLYHHIEENNAPDIVMFNAFKNDKFKNKPFLRTGMYSKNGIMECIFPRLIESVDSASGSAIRASVCLRLFKSSLVKKSVRFNIDLRNNEDLVYCFEATLKANTFLYLGGSYLYHNCMTEGSLSRGFMDNAFKGMKPLFGILTNIADEYNEYDFTEQISGRVFRTIIFCFENEFRYGNNVSVFKKYRNVKNVINDNEVKAYLGEFKPNKGRSKLFYYYLYKHKMVILTMMFAKYKSEKREREVGYV